MKKVITLSILSLFSIFALSACISEASPESHTGTVKKKHMTQEKVHKIIKKAGKDAGWKMTEFKSNAMIAEKIDGANSVALTVTFSNSSYDISPKNSDLASAIDSALN